MKNDNQNRNPKPDQYKRDWAYAARALDKGELPEKVVKDIAAFRKDLPDPQKYAETTVAKVQEHLEVQAELKTENKSQDKTPGASELKRMFKQVSDLEYARHLYEDGKDKAGVIEALHNDKKAAPDYALVTATEAELRRFAERDLDYAIRARERGETNDQIIPKITEYRQGNIDNPQQYARAVLDAADRTRQAEHGIAPDQFVGQRVVLAQQQYRRDLHFAALQLESQTRNQVQAEITQRRPERAYDSPSFRLHGKPDPSYAIAVVSQAEKIRAVTDHGRSLEQTLDVAQREFGRQLQEAINGREIGKPASEVVARISQSASAQEPYARAIVNQADNIRGQQRELSIRPEMAQTALTQARTSAHELTKTAAIER